MKDFDRCFSLCLPVEYMDPEGKYAPCREPIQLNNNVIVVGTSGAGKICKIKTEGLRKTLLFYYILWDYSAHISILSRMIS